MGHFEDFSAKEVALSWQKIYHNFESKIASPFVEGSIESSEIRAFDRAFIEGATIFGFGMKVELLDEL